MSLFDTEFVDGTDYDPITRELLLQIDDDLEEWDSEREHFLQLRKKIEGYMGFLADGVYEEDHPGIVIESVQIDILAKKEAMTDNYMKFLDVMQSRYGDERVYFTISDGADFEEMRRGENAERPNSSIMKADTIDGFAYDDEEETLILLIVDDLDWDDEYAHLMLVQDKINGYIEFLESGQYRKYNDNREPALVVFRFCFKQDIPSSCETLLTTVAHQIEDEVADFRIFFDVHVGEDEDDDEEYPDDDFYIEYEE